MELLWSCRFLLLLCVCLLNGGLVECELTTVIKTDKGPVVGEILRTVMSSVHYASFRGIPYAKPPIDDLRFQLPQEADPWENVLEATAEGNQCPQVDFVDYNLRGNEDCLYLNVFTPKIDFTEELSTDLLPVMVWLHAGLFATGSGNASYWGPDFILEEGVIMVSCNFRLDILGLLALNIPEAPENLQLKDQVLVLKWVQRNIRKFGGDPNRVTIFGWSSGAVAVDLHMISDISRGLFHGAIAQSSAPWSAWTFSPRSQIESRIFRLGKILGIDTDDKISLYRGLKNKTAEELVNAGGELIEELTHADRKFKPIIENPTVAGENAFLTDCPIRKYKNGEFAQVPFMTGFVLNEMLAFVYDTKFLYWYVELALKQFNGQQHPVQKNLKYLSEELSKVSKTDISELPVELVWQVINDYCLSDRLEKYDNITNIFRFDSVMEFDKRTNVTNTLYASVIDQKQRLVAEMSSAPVYYYRYSYNFEEYSSHRLLEHINPNLNGVAHGDEIMAIFHVSIYNITLDPDHPFSKMRKRMVRMFTNFAKYGNPTPVGASDPLLNITWPRAPGKFLNINESLTVGENPLDEDAESIERDLSGAVWDEFNGCNQRK